MKAFFIICDQELESEVDFILRSNAIDHFTLFKNVCGRGNSGLKQGDSTGPGLNFAYCVVTDNEKAPQLLNEFETFKKQKLKNKGIKIFVMNVEQCL